MRRIVSNTSPLTNLAAIGQLNLLHRLFGRIDIAHAVWNELNANGRSCLYRAGWNDPCSISLEISPCRYSAMSLEVHV